MEIEAQDEKGQIYAKDYVKGDLFWGFGIEREFYLEVSKTEPTLMRDLWLKNQRERYSVDYASDFSEKKRKAMADKDSDMMIDVPLYLNAHSLDKTDEFGQHKTVWASSRIENPKFSGKTLLDRFVEEDSFFVDQRGFGKNFVFDGDTFEIATRKFYKKTIESVLREHSEKKREFIDRCNGAWKSCKLDSKYGSLRISETNHGWVKFWTNPNNVALCNNGTFHLNITLPTALDSSGKLSDPTKFIRDHLECAKYLQWFEPMLMAFLGSPDVFSIMSDEGGFADGSLRVALSRYIGMGTYDVRSHQTGKVLNLSRSNIDFEKLDFWWMKQTEETMSYRSSSTTGLDFNVKKHVYSGLEWRIFDSFPEQHLKSLCKFLCLACDYAIESSDSKQEELKEPLSFPGSKILDKMAEWFQSCTMNLFRYRKVLSSEHASPKLKTNQADEKGREIAGSNVLWNEIAHRSVAFGNLGCFLSVEEMDRLAEQVGFPYPKDCSWKRSKEAKFSNCLDWINEWCSQVHGYYKQKGEWGPCYSKMVENKDQPPKFLVDWNNTLWLYQFFYYSPRFEYTSTSKRPRERAGRAGKRRKKMEREESLLFSPQMQDSPNKPKTVKPHRWPHRFHKMFDLFGSIFFFSEKDRDDGKRLIRLFSEEQKQELRFLHLFSKLKWIDYEIEEFDVWKRSLLIRVNICDSKADYWKAMIFLQHQAHKGMDRFSDMISSLDFSFESMEATLLKEAPELMDVYRSMMD